jgi:hypothetical protein
MAVDRQAARAALSAQAQAMVEHVWAMPTLKRVVPPGEDPIATRCDPVRQQLHIACASGKTFVFSFKDMVKAEESPIIEPKKTTDPVLLDMAGNPIPASKPKDEDEGFFKFEFRPGQMLSIPPPEMLGGTDIGRVTESKAGTGLPPRSNILKMMEEVQRAHMGRLAKENPVMAELGTEPGKLKEDIDTAQKKLDDAAADWEIAVARLMELQKAIQNYECVLEGWTFGRNTSDGEVTVYCDQSPHGGVATPANLLAINDGFGPAVTYALCATCFVEDQERDEPLYRLDCDTEGDRPKDDEEEPSFDETDEDPDDDDEEEPNN